MLSLSPSTSFSHASVCRTHKLLPFPVTTGGRVLFWGSTRLSVGRSLRLVRFRLLQVQTTVSTSRVRWVYVCTVALQTFIAWKPAVSLVMTLGVRKINFSGKTPANRNRSGPNSLHVHVKGRQRPGNFERDRPTGAKEFSKIFSLGVICPKWPQN